MKMLLLLTGGAGTVLAAGMLGMPKNRPAGQAIATVEGRQFRLRDDPSCRIDQSQMLQSAIDAAAGKTLTLPRGTFCITRPDGTLKVKAPRTHIVGQGQATLLRWAAPRGSRVAPLLDIQPSAPFSGITNVAFDHGADKGDYAGSRYFGIDTWGTVMMSIQADNFVGTHLWGRAGFDNCFGVSRRLPDGRADPGKPQGVQLTAVRTELCGVGRHEKGQGGPGRIGAGVNNGSARGTLITDARDVGSYGSYMADIGAAGSATWRKIVSIGSRRDEVAPPAIYVGDQNNIFDDVEIVEPQGDAIWADAFSTGSTFTNIRVRSPKAACISLKGAGTWRNVTCSGVSRYGGSSAGVVKVDASMDMVDVSITGLRVETTSTPPEKLVDVEGSKSYRLRMDGAWPAGMAVPRSQGLILSRQAN
jgi:hypothetical protein